MGEEGSQQASDGVQALAPARAQVMVSATATASSNEQIRSLTGRHLRQDTASHRNAATFLHVSHLPVVWEMNALGQRFCWSSFIFTLRIEAKHMTEVGMTFTMYSKQGGFEMSPGHIHRPKRRVSTTNTVTAKRAITLL
ncbi:hypothetical protein EYF80_003334 [Liparis tanakae]|uniref:Uncharacterized protein n=1 Tax=Liparis tanakae TaxID=230148 RepID=A0A4Z2J9U8_9TELE|nr:hypothetical protein EYF80_003334 [Liparis tanakae]